MIADRTVVANYRAGAAGAHRDAAALLVAKMPSTEIGAPTAPVAGRADMSRKLSLRRAAVAVVLSGAAHT